MSHERVVLRQQIFGYTNEEVNLLVKPMALTGGEALGSMGTDTPIAVLSSRPRMLFDYFSQLFAQVTNPPLDAIREEIVTSLGGTIGPEGDLLNPTADIVPADRCSRSRSCTTTICRSSSTSTTRSEFPGFRSVVIRGLYPVAEGGEGLRRALASIRDAGVRRPSRVAHASIVLSDRESDEKLRADPVAAAHLRGAPPPGAREDAHQGRSASSRPATPARCTTWRALFGFGAAAVNPYMAFETIDELLQNGDLPEGMTLDKAIANYIKAAGKGVLKVMSKMGISTLASYTGAQLFQVIGLSQDLVDEYFTGLQSQLGGIGLDEIAADVAARHRIGVPRPSVRARAPRARGGRRVPVAS